MKNIKQNSDPHPGPKPRPTPSKQWSVPAKQHNWYRNPRLADCLLAGRGHAHAEVGARHRQLVLSCLWHCQVVLATHITGRKHWKLSQPLIGVELVHSTVVHSGITVASRADTRFDGGSTCSCAWRHHWCTAAFCLSVHQTQLNWLGGTSKLACGPGWYTSEPVLLLMRCTTLSLSQTYWRCHPVAIPQTMASLQRAYRNCFKACDSNCTRS